MKFVYHFKNIKILFPIVLFMGLLSCKPYWNEIAKQDSIYIQTEIRQDHLLNNDLLFSGFTDLLDNYFRFLGLRAIFDECAVTNKIKQNFDPKKSDDYYISIVMDINRSHSLISDKCKMSGYMMLKQKNRVINKKRIKFTYKRASLGRVVENAFGSDVFGMNSPGQFMYEFKTRLLNSYNWHSKLDALLGCSVNTFYK